MALIGGFAREPRYQGAGSSEVKPTRVENLHDELPHGAYARGYAEDERARSRAAARGPGRGARRPRRRRLRRAAAVT